jgi:1-acyl-sn-glycerol-3-phosphate acyltransferase
MEPQRVLSYAPDELRDFLPAFLASYIREPSVGREVAAAVARVLEDAADAAMTHLQEAIVDLGSENRLYAADPLARRVSRAFGGVMMAAPRLEGLDRLRDAASGGPTVVVCNHCSYFDSTALDALVATEGAADIADRVVSIAGPKVYDEPFRRFASLCLNTLPVPQSTRLEGTARLGPRELAVRALQSVRAAHTALDEGRILLLFAEGSRTRTGRLRPFLRAVHRYLDHPGARVVPAALEGTDGIFPLDTDRLQQHRVHLRFGDPIPVVEGALRALETAHGAVRDLLPDYMRPEPGEAALA